MGTTIRPHRSALVLFLVEIQAINGHSFVVAHDGSGIIGLAGFLGEDTLSWYTTAFQQLQVFLSLISFSMSLLASYSFSRSRCSWRRFRYFSNSMSFAMSSATSANVTLFTQLSKNRIMRRPRFPRLPSHRRRQPRFPRRSLHCPVHSPHRLVRSRNRPSRCCRRFWASPCGI